MMTCPSCKSENVCLESAIEPYIDNELKQHMSCGDCDNSWINIYELKLVARVNPDDGERFDATGDKP